MTSTVGERLLAASMAVSLLLAVAFGVVYFWAPSQLGMAQAVDSLADLLTGGALLFALAVSRRPPDDDHHFGHRNAQPVAALVVAVLVGVLATEVLLSAIESLRLDRAGALGWPLASVITFKVIAKVVLLRVASNAEHDASSAMRAFSTDARNDALLGALSLVGFWGAQSGWPLLDAWFAIPVALWIFVSGLMLATESIRLLMGSAPEPERLNGLRRCVERTPGVIRVGRLRARHHGTDLDVWVEIFVNPALSIGRAHDLGETVESCLLQEPDVSNAIVHVDAHRDEST